MANEFQRDIQSLHHGERVELYILDLNPIGYNQVLYFTPSNFNTGSIAFNGNTYTNASVSAKGFKKSKGEDFAEPTLTVGNVGGLAGGLLASYDGLIGAKVTRLVTFSHYLDGEANADAAATFLPEVYWVEQKLNHNKLVVEFKLSAILDLSEMKLPRRRVFKNICERVYRYYDEALGDFNYAEVECPYAGANYFKRDGSVTSDPSEDECGKDFQSCKLRFPNEALPTWACPGVRNRRL